MIATGRNVSKLEHLQNTAASILQLDVTDGQETINEKMQEAISIYSRIDVLVNNAGACDSINHLRDIKNQHDVRDR